MSGAIKPFCGTHYNPSKIADFSAVVCPPYDVIDKKLLSSLRKKSSYNFSHILLSSDSNYEKAGDKFRKWLESKILIDDGQESLYLYEQKFKCEGRVYRRFGFLSLLRMDRKDSIFPHEHTLKEPKEDRKRIIKEMKTNLSPIFVIIPKPLEVFHQTYKTYYKRKPLFEFKDHENNDNLVWKIDDKKLIDKICSVVDRSSLVIADGHHRFEVSYDYYKKNKGKFKNLNYVLAYIADAQKGLLILPTHRVVSVRGEPKDILARLKEYFTITETNAETVEKKLKSKKGIFSFGLYCGRKFYFLKLKDSSVLDKKFGDSAYKKIDSYLLQQFIFPLIDLEGKIEYTHSVGEAKQMAGKKKTAFLLRSASLENVFEIANKGYRLPQKSTYFYPKLVSGVVLRRFKE
jgi:uncharacterized protein (DUF1015 family)